MKKVDAIFFSDPHLSEGQPVCRTDVYPEAFWPKLSFISDLQKKHDCDVYCGGDLFEFWKASPWLLTMASKYLPKRLHTIYGQHDLPQHNFELRKKSATYNLKANGVLKTFKTCNWNQKPKEPSIVIKGRKILVWHYFNYQGREPWPGCEAPSGNKLLKKYPQFDVILTGDNHVTFTKEYKGRLLINPGSMTRHKADQIDHRPCVFLYNAEKNKAKKVYIPIKEGVVSREHIDKEKERDSRIDAFISSLETEWDFSMSFEKNLETFFSKNKTRKKIKNIIKETF